MTVPGPPVTSGPPPAGTVTVKGPGWRVNVPTAVLLTVLGALATRLASTEQRAFEQSASLQAMAAALKECRERK